MLLQFFPRLFLNKDFSYIDNDVPYLDRVHIVKWPKNSLFESYIPHKIDILENIANYPGHSLQFGYENMWPNVKFSAG